MPWKVPDTLSLLFWLPVAPCFGQLVHMFMCLWDAGEAGSPSGSKFHTFSCQVPSCWLGSQPRDRLSVLSEHLIQTRGAWEEAWTNTPANAAETSLLGAVGCCPLLLETLFIKLGATVGSITTPFHLFIPH